MPWKMVHNVARDDLLRDVGAASDFTEAFQALRPVTDRLPLVWQGGDVDRLIDELAAQARIVNSVQTDVYNAVDAAWLAEPAEVEAWADDPGDLFTPRPAWPGFGQPGPWTGGG